MWFPDPSSMVNSPKLLSSPVIAPVTWHNTPSYSSRLASAVESTKGTGSGLPLLMMVALAEVNCVPPLKLPTAQEQHDFAVERINKAGLSDKVQIVMQDYRDETEQYDGIASIEMFEAVGEKYWPVYFDKVNSCLKSGANATLQIITIPDDRFIDYRNSVDFIQKYIFPVFNFLGA